MLSRLMLEQFEAAEFERQARLRKAWTAYGGRLPDPLKKTEGDPDAKDNVKLPLSELIVDKSVSFLFGFSLDFEVDGERETAEEEWLGKCLDANRRMTTLHKLGINGAVAGHAFLKVLLPDVARHGHPYPRLVVWDPACVLVRWEPHDCDQVLSYTYQWHGVDPHTAKPTAYRQVIERDGSRWLITDQESTGDHASWVTVSETPWPYPWAPVFACQNRPVPNEYWGKSDLEEPIWEANHSLNFVVSNINRILRIYAHPYIWGRGFSGKIDTTPGQIPILPSMQGELKSLEMQSDLSSSLEFFRELKAAFHSVTRVPEVAAGRVEDLGALSGLALKILYGPLVELTETKRLTYGELLQDLGKRLLELGGFGPDHVVKPQWPAALPADEKGEAETALLDHQLGASRDTLLTRRGYDPQAEAEKRGEEDANAAQLAQQMLKSFDRGEGEDGGEEAEGEE